MRPSQTQCWDGLILCVSNAVIVFFRTYPFLIIASMLSVESLFSARLR